MKGLFLPILTALAVVMAMPLATVLADTKVPLSCTIVLAVTAPGTEEFEKNKLEVSGQELAGALDCNVPSLSGGLVVMQGAEVKVDALGNFKGRVEGSFVTAGGLTGELAGRISGGSLADLSTLSETIDGKWELKGAGVEGKGKFSITLAFDPGLGTLVGGGPLTGALKLDD